MPALRQYIVSALITTATTVTRFPAIVTVTATMIVYSSFFILIILAGLGSHCLMAPAAAGGSDSQLLEPGLEVTYHYETTLLMNEPQLVRGQGKDVGYQLMGQLTLTTLWQSSSNPLNKLLQLQLINPKLSVKSRKAPEPEGFIYHTSKIEEQTNGQFYIHWDKGNVKSVYINQNEAVSLVNLKKGIASIFQFQQTNQEVKETDASGSCTVLYTSLDRNMVEKIKSDCHSELPFVKHPNQLWDASVSSRSRSIIVLSDDLTTIDSVDSEESHELRVPLRDEAGAAVLSKQHLKLQDRSSKMALIQENSIDAAIKYIEKSSGQSLAKHKLMLTREDNMCTDGTCPTFQSLVKNNRDALKTENLGTTKSAAAFVKLVNIARESKKEDLIKTLKSSKNKNILLQLLDVLGAAQTTEAHAAAFKVVNFKSEEDLDLNERYLWSLSLGSHPVPDVLSDIVTLMKSGPYNEKLEETMALTVAAMANKMTKNKDGSKHKLAKDILKIITTKLEECSTGSETCPLQYIRALKNLGDAESIPTLLKFAINGNKKVSVAAINAVHSFPKSDWSPDVIKAAKKIYFQLEKRYDSSARTLALDILLKYGPDEALLTELLYSLQNRDPAYEIKQYLMQRIWQTGESVPSLIPTVKGLLKTLNLTNYNILSQRGLSTAFTRSFMKHPSANGSLSTIQEMSGGIVKRGLVDVIIDKDGFSQSIFTLGLFAGGLGSFLSSDSNNSEEEEEETAVAGMDLNVMGVQLRPFVFFTGQGELMGHVWSGTASDRTPAFQALALLQDHLQYIPLQAGYMAELRLQGGLSFDLSGQISLSIWNRNAESLVEKSAGLSLTGIIRVNTMFVHSQVQFNLASEVKLRLVSNIDFSGEIALCLQLQQPDSIIKHNVHKVERIPGSKHKLRKSKYKMIPVPGRTYALNQKNNELCNVIFAEQ